MPAEDFLLTEPPFNTPENRELMAEMMSHGSESKICMHEA